jgi:DNA-binding beta-propeller fold protein YncE
MRFERGLCALATGLALGGCGVTGGFAGGPYLYETFAYVANQNSNDVTVLKMNDATGVLTGVQTFPCGAAPLGIAADPLGRFVFVANSTDSTVTAATIDPVAGSLTQVEAHPSASGAKAVLAHASGKFVYALGTSELRAYTVGGSGALTDLQTVPDANAPSTMVFDPAGAHLYVIDWSPSQITYFSIDPHLGTLTAQGSAATIPTGVDPTGMAFDPQGAFAFVAYSANSPAGTTESFSVSSSGILTDTGSSLSAPGGTLDNGSAVPDGFPISVTTDAAGVSLYVADNLADELTVASIDRGSGALTRVTDATGFFRPSWVGFEPGGQYLFVANEGVNNLFAMSADSTGVPARVGLGSADDGPVAVAITRVPLAPGGPY